MGLRLSVPSHSVRKRLYSDDGDPFKLLLILRRWTNRVFSSSLSLAVWPSQEGTHSCIILLLHRVHSVGSTSPTDPASSRHHSSFSSFPHVGSTILPPPTLPISLPGTYPPKPIPFSNSRPFRARHLYTYPLHSLALPPLLQRSSEAQTSTIDPCDTVRPHRQRNRRQLRSVPGNPPLISGPRPETKPASAIRLALPRPGQTRRAASLDSAGLQLRSLCGNAPGVVRRQVMVDDLLLRTIHAATDAIRPTPSRDCRFDSTVASVC